MKMKKLDSRFCARATFALVIGIAACSGTPQGARIATHNQLVEATGPLCQFEGQWSRGSLRATKSGERFVSLHNGKVLSQLDRSEGELRIHAQVTKDGWTFLGWSDPAEDGLLSLRAQRWIHPGVALSPHAQPTITDARAGEALISIPHHSPARDDDFHFAEPAQQWISCDELVTTTPLRTPNTAKQHRVALGFPAELPERALQESATPYPLALQPGGEPFVTITRDEHPLRVLLLAERGEYARVLIQDWTGTNLVGWIASDRLGEYTPGQGGLLGSLAGPRELTVCQSPEQLALGVSHAGRAPEPAGVVAPNTRFVRLEERDDGSLSIRPHPSASVYLVGDETDLLIQPTQPLRCGQESHDPMGALGSLLSEPAATLRAEARVTRVTGLGDVAVSSTCEALVEHHPNNPISPCRVELRCGEHTLYGHNRSLGHIPGCEIDPDAEPPLVRGRDVNPTQPENGDGQLDIDTSAGTLRVSDSEHGHLGEFELEAEITNIERIIQRDEDE